MNKAIGFAGGCFMRGVEGGGRCLGEGLREGADAWDGG